MRNGRPSRREALGIFQAAGVTALLGCGGNSALTPSAGGGSTGQGGKGGAGGGGGGMREDGACVARPPQTEGPYFVDDMLERSDIRSDPLTGITKEGVPLRVIFRVSRLVDGECVPMPGALVDLWQCDALGVYGDVLDAAGMFDTRGQQYLRGFQRTDAAGLAEFLTIYPGWYAGRTVHLHFKVREESLAVPTTEFTSQLYFDDALTDEVMTQAPYDTRGPRSTVNAMDGIFIAGGETLTLGLDADGAGYVGLFELGVAT